MTMNPRAASEKRFFGAISTGTANDTARVTEIAG